MANYQNIVNACRAAVPTGCRFIHGRLVDFSQSFSGVYPLVTLLPFTLTDARSTPDAVFDSANLILGFWQQDRPDTTPEEREALIAEMDMLSDTFINSLLDNNPAVKLSNIQKEPQYQFYQGTLSGYAISFTIQIISPC
jgi:hypothetical protein